MSYMMVQEVRPEDAAKVLLMRRSDAVDVCAREILQANTPQIMPGQ